MAKTVLINPGSECEIYSATEPLNLGFIAGYLEKNGVEVRIIDEMANENPIKMINELKPDMVGITATTPLVTRAYEIADYCRDRKILTIMGGVHASVLSEEALKHCDIVVKGEGEQAILDIVKNGMRQKIVSMPYIKNLDEIPPPARHLFKMNFYLKSGERLPTHTYNFAPKGSNTAALMCSRGCPYNCTFCHNSWREMPFRFNSAERVISEIKSLIERYNVNAIFFLDDDMFANNPRLKKICETIIKEKFNILWSCAARSNNINLKILELARESGCIKINFGFESGSQKILNVLNKRNTVEENQKAIDLCRKAKIEPCGSFMIGNPTETMEDINLTRQFIRRSKLKYKSILITTPFPGTKLWEWCKEKNLVPENFSWKDFTYSNCPIPANENFTPAEIEKIHGEIAEELYSNEPIDLLGFIWRKLSHPIDTIKKTIAQPSKILKVLKRLKLWQKK